MDILTGKCSSCGKMIPMWRCGETTGGGTYHIICFECNAKDSQKSGQSTVVWRWVGWILVTGLMIGTFFALLLLGSH